MKGGTDRHAKYRADNHEKVLAAQAKHRAANPEKVRRYHAAWLVANPGKAAAYTNKWQAANPAKLLAQAAKQRAAKRAQSPPLTMEEQASIVAFYAKARALTELSGIKHEVDHKKPLSKGGLHHPDNLQIMTRAENRRKSSKFTVVSLN